MDDDRAQLMLVGAITIAVIFLGLVAVLNTGLYTSNVAPRAGLSATADAETFVEGVDHDAPILLGTAAEERLDGEVYAFEPVVADEIRRYESYLLRAVGNERAATVAVGLNRTVNGSGWLLVDDDPGTEFDPADDTDDPDWTLAEDVDRTNGSITLYRFPVHNATEMDTFTLEADDGDDEWALETYWENDSGGEVHIRVPSEGEDCTFPQEQPTNASGVTIDLSEGTVREIGCSFTTIENSSELDAGAPYDLTIRRSGFDDAPRARGTYTIGVDGASFGDIHDGGVVVGGPNVTDVPYSVPQLEAAVLDLRYTAPSLRHETEIRVEPRAVELPPPPLIGEGVVFVNDTVPRDLSLIRGQNDRVSVYDVTTPSVIGPAEIDFDADGLIEVPYVDSAGSIRLIDVANESAMLPSDEVDLGAQTRLAVGTWNGSAVSVFYVGDGTINRTTPGARAPVRLNATADHGVTAPVGPADIDADGVQEFVYVDGAGQVRYFEDANGTTNTTAAVAVDAAGVGPAYDFDGDGAADVPFVDGDGNVSLVNGTGPPVDLFRKHDIANSERVDAAPIAVHDVNDDGDGEIVYLRDEEPFFLENVGGNTVNEQRLQPEGDLGNSTSVNASDEQGVA